MLAIHSCPASFRTQFNSAASTSSGSANSSNPVNKTVISGWQIVRGPNECETNPRQSARPAHRGPLVGGPVDQQDGSVRHAHGSGRRGMPQVHIVAQASVPESGFHDGPEDLRVQPRELRETVVRQFPESWRTTSRRPRLGSDSRARQTAAALRRPATCPARKGTGCAASRRASLPMSSRPRTRLCRTW